MNNTDVVLYERKEECCGCSACACICPVEAVSMKCDEEGFLYPEVNDEFCIHCNRCISVCMFKKQQNENCSDME